MAGIWLEMGPGTFSYGTGRRIERAMQPAWSRVVYPASILLFIL